jgi:hypothetical protein
MLMAGVSILVVSGVTHYLFKTRGLSRFDFCGVFKVNFGLNSEDLLNFTSAGCLR